LRIVEKVRVNVPTSGLAGQRADGSERGFEHIVTTEGELALCRWSAAAGREQMTCEA
jgi:hypothetical protein